MAIVARSELQDAIARVLGDRSDDEAIALMENFTDTLNDYDSRVGEDWKGKYEANDAEWRRRYMDRFNGTSSDEDLEGGQLENLEVETVIDEENTTKWDDLYE